MIAELARNLHQQIDAVEEWEDDKFFLYHDEMSLILKNEDPER